VRGDVRARQKGKVIVVLKKGLRGPSTGEDERKKTEKASPAEREKSP